MIGKFIIFEGADGCGKSTQIKMASEYLTSKGVDHLLTREPGGTILAEKLRSILKNPDLKISRISQLMLFLTAREDQLTNVIIPALKKGKHVLCDRYYISTLLYQVQGSKELRDIMDLVTPLITSQLLPDLGFIYDVDYEVAQQRIGSRNESIPDAFDDTVSYELYQAYKAFNEPYITHLDANQDVEELFKLTKSKIDSII